MVQDFAVNFFSCPLKTLAFPFHHTGGVSPTVKPTRNHKKAPQGKKEKKTKIQNFMFSVPLRNFPGVVCCFFFLKNCWSSVKGEQTYYYTFKKKFF